MCVVVGPQQGGARAQQGAHAAFLTEVPVEAVRQAEAVVVARAQGDEPGLSGEELEMRTRKRSGLLQLATTIYSNLSRAERRKLRDRQHAMLWHED